MRFIYQKVRISNRFWYFCVFRPVGVMYDSQAIEVRRRGWEFSQGVLLLLLVAWESYTTPSCTATHIFIAIQIMVK
jgi:hypothetical protein